MKPIIVKINWEMFENKWRGSGGNRKVFMTIMKTKLFFECFRHQGRSWHLEQENRKLRLNYKLKETSARLKSIQKLP